jgi:O-antigen/teichoic acid export membrane protein
LIVITPPDAPLPIDSSASDVLDFASVDRRLARNAVWLVAAQIATLASGLVILVAITRLLTPEDLGRWRFSQAILAFVLVLADAGLTSFAIREIARRATSATTFGWTLLLVRVTIATLAIVVTIAALAIASEPPATVLVVAIMGGSAIAVALGPAYVLQAREDFRGLAVIRITAQAIGAVAALAALVVTGSLAVAAAGILSGAIVATIITNRLVARAGDVGHGLSLREAKLFLRGSAPFIGAGLAVMVIFNADAFLIQFLRGDRALGLYAVAYAIAAYTLIIGGALMSAAFPRVVRAAELSTPNSFIGELAAVMGLIALPIAVGGTAIAEPLLAALFGPNYVETWPVLTVLMSVPLLGFLNMTLGQTMAAIGLQRGVLVVSAAAATANVVLNLLLIPALGILGAAAVAAATEVISLWLYARLAIRAGVRVPLIDYLGSLPGALAMGIAVVALRALGVTELPVLLLVGVGSYVAFQTLRPSPGARAFWTVVISRANRSANPQR